ncbi:hypothetical protein H8D36_03110 [archaeon]|nr:hypothetical protein [archaeon]
MGEILVNDTRRERLENLSRLRNKKEQELKELEEKKKKELTEAEEMLKAGIEDLTEEEIQIIENLKKAIPELQEIEEETAKKEEPEISLEETLATEAINEETREAAQKQPIYGESTPIEETARAIYARSDYNVFNDLSTTLQKVEQGEYLTLEERNQFYNRQEEFKRLQVNNEIIDEKDPFGYINRSKQVIDSIDKTLHSQSLYKQGDNI